MPESKLFIVPREPHRPRDIPNNLPSQPTPLIGREQEVDAACRLLSGVDDQAAVRLLTMVGPGGVGKTRLALQVAEDLLDRFEGGVFLVELAPVTDPDLVVPTITGTLQLQESPGVPLLSTLKQHLRDKSILLVLDNFEQVIGGGPTLAELLADCPRLTLLITSRSALRRSAEHQFPVAPLSLPDPSLLSGGRHLGIDRVSKYGSVALFVQRARAVNPDFELTDSNSAAVVEVCRRVDGLPLAIELVAAHARLLPPQSILARLAHPLRLLTQGTQEHPARHHTMRDTIEWSFDLLSEQEQSLFRRVSIFVGGFSLRAAEAVCNDAGDIAIEVDNPMAIGVLEGIEALVDKSLLHKSDKGDNNDPRLLMLETVREYALEQLVASGEAEVMRRRHADYYVALAARMKPDIENSDVATWMARLVPEHDNLRAAMLWLLERDGSADNEAALHLIVDLRDFWGRRYNMSEVQQWLETALTNSDKEVTLLRVNALRVAANTSYLKAEYERSHFWAEQALAAARELKNDKLVADTLGLIGLLAIFRGEYEQARIVLEEALDIYRQIGNEFGVGVSYINLGEAMRYQGDYARAEANFRESLRIFRALGRNGGILQSLNNIGFAAYVQGDLFAARNVFLEGLSLAVEIDARKQAAEVLTGMSGVLLAESGAGSPIESAALPDTRPHNVVGVTEPVHFLGIASAIVEQSGRQLEPLEQAHYDRNVASARAALGEEAFAAAWEEGRNMTLNQALDLANRLYGPGSETSQSREHGGADRQSAGGLTAREREVTALVAQGLTNEAIANRLVLSERTVEMHVSNALHKLGLTARTQLAAWAIHNDLESRSRD